ncbi:MAG: GtrA family protein [Oscillospiraceae bacterium]
MKKLWDIYKKHEEIINYLIVGVLTTVVSLFFYYASTRTFLDPSNAFQLQIANIIKWITGVLFAYVTNRIFVFKSKNKDIKKEFITFSSSRVATLFLDMIVMGVLVSKMGINDLVANLLSLVLVTVANYILSKIFVFKGDKKDKQGE